MTDAQRVNQRTPRAWIWPWRPSLRLQGQLYRLVVGLSGLPGPWYGWCLAGLLIGTVPLAVAYAFDWPGHHAVTGMLLMPLLVGAVVRDSLRLAVAGVGAALVGHSALIIGLVANDPASAAAFFPAGEAYWQESCDWILTGRSKEYLLSWWLPAHGQLLVAALLFSYTSLGFVTLWQGLYEVDLMNCYVGRLLLHAQNPAVALTVGWHPWSVCRGVGYLLLTFAIVGVSLERLTGRSFGSGRRRAAVAAAGLGFVLLDGVLKFTLLEPVRQVLLGNWRP